MSADFQGTPSTLTGRQFAATVNVLAGRRIVGPASIEDEIGANQDDWEPAGLADANFISVTQDGGPFSISGLAGGGAKTIKNICNDDSDENLTLKHQDASSEAANRFNLGGSDVMLAPGEAIALEYDTAAERWNKVTVVVPFPLANDPGDPGLPGLNWLGAWVASPSTDYAENDGVSNNGRSYICLVAHSSDSTNEPGAGVYTANYWSLLADKGADGTGTGDMQASVYDPNGVEADAFDQDNMVDGTTNKNYSATEKTKLAGIASSADVTSATNVGSSIHGSTAKTTPVDADEVGLIDSAASNVLKKLTWTNIKATLKTYFDTLYATAAQGALADSAAQKASNLSDLANAGTARTNLGVAIGSDVQAFDADILKADTADVLTKGFAATPYSAGTKSSGTFTPDEANGNFQYATNGGAHTLAPPTNSCTLIIEYTNNGSAGTITTSGFTKVTGDTPATTNGNKYFYFITKHQTYSHLHVQALQ